MDNVDIAIYNMLNEVASRHGLRPCDFRATFGPVGLNHELTFVWPADDNAEMRGKYRTMLLGLGIPPGEQSLVGNVETIYGALEHLLQQVPAKRPPRAR